MATLMIHTNPTILTPGASVSVLVLLQQGPKGAQVPVQLRASQGSPSQQSAAASTDSNGTGFATFAAIRVSRPGALVLSAGLADGTSARLEISVIEDFSTVAELVTRLSPTALLTSMRAPRSVALLEMGEAAKVSPKARSGAAPKSSEPKASKASGAKKTRSTARSGRSAPAKKESAEPSTGKAKAATGKSGKPTGASSGRGGAATKARR